MEHRKLNSFICECGLEISARALSRHLKSQTRIHTKQFIQRCLSTIELAKVKRIAWTKSEGVHGKSDAFWIIKVLSGKCNLSDLSFESPRPIGQNTPEAYTKSSKNRVGLGNPSLKDKPIYPLTTLSSFCKNFYKDNKKNPSKYSDLLNKLTKTFPFYGFSLIGKWEHNIKKDRGHSRQNLYLSLLLDKPVEEIIQERANDRGILIQKGQKKSEKFVKMINAGKDKLKSFVSIPHLTLFNMIQSVDPKAIKEKHIDFQKTWKSYDIFSPKLNILIEMHGHVWHDWHKSKSNMYPLVHSNVINDVIKTCLAEQNGYKLVVFWDDDTDNWEKQIEALYGQKSKKYEQALSEEIDKKAKKTSI